MNLTQQFDRSSLIVAAITLVLFIAALFAKGFTHDLLLEAGIFLVSVKLIIMAYQNLIETAAVHQRLDEIQAAIEHSRPQNSRRERE